MGSCFHCRVFVAWTGFVLYNGNELVPTLMQGAAFAVGLGAIADLIKIHSLS